MSDFKSRLNDEKVELDSKIEKLSVMFKILLIIIIFRI